eukprot:5436897-Pleurochrysis_carterae.AAC.1
MKAIKQYKSVSNWKMYEMNVEVKSQSPAPCKLRYLDRLAHEIAISVDSYLEPTPVLVER